MRQTYQQSSLNSFRLLGNICLHDLLDYGATESVIQTLGIWGAGVGGGVGVGVGDDSGEGCRLEV